MLSALFREEPTLAVVEPILDTDRFSVICADLSGIEAGAAQESLGSLREVLANLDWPGAQEAPFAVRREYADLFLTRGAIHPYESVYRGDEGRLMDWPWEQVRDFYLASGFEIDSSELHPEDHISAELGFMAITCHVARDARPDVLGSLLEVQRRFLAEHLLAWLPDLLKDVEADKRSHVYRAVTNLALSYARADLDTITAAQHATERRDQ